MISHDDDIVNEEVEEVEEVEEEEFLDVPISDLREKIRHTANAIDQHYVMMGGYLHEVSSRKLYRDWGYPTLNDYIEKDVEIGQRRGQRMRQIWKLLVKKFGIDKDRLAGCRYSNLVEIISLYRPNILTKETAGDWVDRAFTMTYSTLKKEVECAKAMRLKDESVTITPASIPGADPEIVKSPIKRKSFKFTDEEANLVDETISTATSDRGSDRDGHLLANICAFYMANKTSDPVMKDYLLSKLTNVYGGLFIHLQSAEEIEAWEESSILDDEADEE